MANRDRELVLLDTHIWLWAVFRSDKLDTLHADIIRTAGIVGVSIASFWEVSLLTAQGRLALPDPPKTWFEHVVLESGITVLPLTPGIAADAYSLPEPFHSDAADRLIVATARNLDYLLLTEDEKILDYPHVRTA